MKVLTAPYLEGAVILSEAMQADAAPVKACTNMEEESGTE
jgi:hypothetical protein